MPNASADLILMGLGSITITPGTPYIATTAPIGKSDATQPNKEVSEYKYTTKKEISMRGEIKYEAPTSQAEWNKLIGFYQTSGYKDLIEGITVEETDDTVLPDPQLAGVWHIKSAQMEYPDVINGVVLSTRRWRITLIEYNRPVDPSATPEPETETPVITPPDPGELPPIIGPFDE